MHICILWHIVYVHGLECETLSLYAEGIHTSNGGQTHRLEDISAKGRYSTQNHMRGCVHKQ